MLTEPGVRGAHSAAAPEFPDSPARTEAAFYGQYSWCLNAFPALREVIAHLRAEAAKLRVVETDWRREEVLTNVWLFSCAVSDTVDDFLMGPVYDFSQAAGVFSPARLVVGPLNRAARALSGVRGSTLGRLAKWRGEWELAVAGFMRSFAAGEAVSCGPMLELLERSLPERLLAARPRIPAAFRSQDLTHFDAFTLGRKFVEQFPDRERPVVVAGLRTAGSYFAPLLRGYLESRGYGDVTSLTLRAKLGAGRRERALLSQAARSGAMAAIIDEPVFSSNTVARGLGLLKAAGFAAGDIVSLFPAHPGRRNWRSSAGSIALAAIRVITLEPEEWHKRDVLDRAAAGLLRDYFQGEGVTVDIDQSGAAGLLTRGIETSAEPGFHWRLKRVYEVTVRPFGKEPERHMVFAKSAGWGWHAYHAFLAGTRLDGFVPKVIGMRSGILFTEWVPSETRADPCSRRRSLVECASAYVAGRVRTLRLDQDPTADLVRAVRHRATDEIAAVLSGAFGWKIAAALSRPRIRRRLSALSCPCPTLIDGKMRPLEWVGDGHRWLKADFEHHGMGKHELNLSDPAYDLAETILQWRLSQDEERELIRRYAALSGDSSVTGRLFLYKLLAGTWSMARAFDNLSDARVCARHPEFSRRYLRALEFLTAHTTRFCAELCRRRQTVAWSGPLVVLDIDGVLDKQIFGFPSTTAAGVKAMSLLASHGIAVALNTARPVSELKEYCRAYGLVGGAAEYGAFVWDAVGRREQVLADADALAQMARLRARLRALPGVYVNDGCRLSVRAFCYSKGRTVPVPEMLVLDLMASLHLDRLSLHQTYTDSTITASACDKGSGLLSLLALAGHPSLETIAVGDSEPDLPMFRAASRSFAPSQISCAGPASLLGCRIAKHAYQPGLLEITRTVLHPDGRTCPDCNLPEPALEPGERIFLQLLRTADRSPAVLLLRSLIDPRAIEAFLQ